MDFSYNENQKMISDMIQQFGKNNINAIYALIIKKCVK